MEVVDKILDKGASIAICIFKRPPFSFFLFLPFSVLEIRDDLDKSSWRNYKLFEMSKGGFEI